MYITQAATEDGYGALGRLRSEFVWQAENNLRFPGQYHDRSTGLYYNMFRHYRPDLGRYTTPDRIGLAGGTNLYGYAGQNPINNVDPMGLWEISGRLYIGGGIGFSFGSNSSNWFFSFEYGTGFGASLSWDPHSQGPRHLQVPDPDVLSGFVEAMFEKDALGARFGPFSAGSGWESYSGVGVNKTSDGIVGCGEESDDPDAPFGSHSPGFQYEGPVNYLSLSATKWAFGFSRYSIRGTSLGFHWKW